MKKVFLCILLLNLLIFLHPTKSYTQQNKVQVPIEQVFSFMNDNYDFGKIPFGQPATYKIKITNISKQPAWLDSVKVSCGCTTPKYTPRQKLKPKESTEVELGFDGRANGNFTKEAMIFLNNGQFTKIVNFKGEAVQNKPNQ